MDDRLNLYFIIPTLGSGGAERVCVNLANFLSSQGHLVKIILLKEEGVNRKLLTDDVKIRCMNAHRTLFAIPKLARLLADEPPPCVCSFLPNANIATMIAARLSRFRGSIVMTEHSHFAGKLASAKPGYRLIFKSLIRHAYQHADQVITVSHRGRLEMIRLLGLPPTKIKTIPNPVYDSSTLRVKMSSPIVDQSFLSAMEKGQTRILAVGRLDPVKRFDLLLEAAKPFLAKGSTLFFLGIGPEKNKLKALAEKLGVVRNVYFLGFQDNPYKYIAKGSILALTSEREGFGNVLVEAMACGVTPVSTDCPYGPSEILAGGRFGYLAEVGSRDAIRNAIKKALSEPLLPQVLMTRAQEYTIEFISRQYEKLFMALRS
jgi:glycosyltransferase involved in cell wall biosynthesis